MGDRGGVTVMPRAQVRGHRLADTALPGGLEGVSLLTDGDSDLTFYDDRAAVLAAGASYSF